jgi:PAS domain S-box-containing protein
VPVVYEGKLGGILYLENNLTVDAFTPARTEMMRLLSTTAAISLEKARLYTEMKSEVARRRAAQEALEESEARFRTMANAAPVMIWIADPTARLTFFNQQYITFTGRSMLQLAGDGWFEDLHPEDRAGCRETYLDAFRNRQSLQIEYRVRRSDGEYRWINDSGVPLYGSDGSFRGYIGSCTDITERKRGEQMLQAVTEGTAPVTGRDFFSSLVRHLALALQVSYAFLAECRDGRHSRSLAFWKGEVFGGNFQFDITGTPCKKVLEGNTCLYSDSLQALFPEDIGLAEWGAESYLGMPLFDSSQRVIGHLAVLDTKPMPEDSRMMTILKIFSARAGAELERHQTAEALRQAEERERVLLEINNAIISDLTQDALFRSISQALKRVVPFDRIAIFLHDSERDLLRLHVLESSLPTHAYFVGLEIKPHDSPAGQAFLQQKPVLRHNLEEERQ